ncbi:MAG: hypothetical protein J6Y69_04675 [Treponema sp.]|nr:hypothetical protein [Treponema sp.]
MPGLSQLKQFNADMLNVGDEVKIRSARGEKPVTIGIPKGIDFEDDSEDFRAGMPQLSEEEQQQAEALAAERDRQANDFSDITGESSESTTDIQSESDTQAVPDVSDLFSPVVSASVDDLDLSEFESESEKEEEVPEEPKETPIEDLDLDALLAPSNPDAQTVQAEEEDDYSYEEAPAQSYRTGRLNPHNISKDNAPKMSDSDFDALMQSAVEASRPEPTVSAPAPAKPAPQEDTTFDMDDANADFETDASLDLNETIPEEFQEHPAPEFVDMDFDKKAEAPAEDKNAPEMDLPDFDVEDEFDNAPESKEASDDSGDSFSMDDMELPDFSDTDDTAPAAEPTQEAVGDLDSGSDSDDTTPDFLDGSETPPEAVSSGDDNEEPLETFDISAMEDMDFSAPGAVKDNSDFDMGDVDGMETSDDDFEIPNFTTTETDPFSSFAKKPAVSTPNFGEALEGDEKNKPKNSFTDAEYKRFRKNLSEYPLNVRIAIEDLVVKNEFTDDAVFEILEKVYRKIPARQLATQLEKMLDISLDVPRDYERRTAEEYENYKSTLEYKVKNKIIPFAILGTFAAVVVFCLFVLFKAFIWDPLQANKYYKQGYSQIQENLYTQSEDSFKSAIDYKPVRKWFFKYAESYRDHKQYERARNVYKEALYRFNRDKWAGIDWADMEMSELYDFKEAERVLRREVLDYHTNDPDALLKLGDLYLEWATESDASKFSLAKLQYDTLFEMYGKNKKLADLYNAREMRYYIRVDDLQQVLTYKEYFYPSKVKKLDGQDLTELSGYLLDKRYGTLRPSEESMREQIVDVKNLLERAVQYDNENATALYNMGRYYVTLHVNDSAVNMFNGAIEVFKSKQRRTRKETYTFIDSYRQLGEGYLDQKEYILAQQSFNEGIDLFEKENRASNFESKPEIGKLYADLGDVNYFINGDMDASLDNYQKAVTYQNDTAAVRYKIGYIQYTNKNYTEAWGSFVHGADSNAEDIHLLLALANTLSLRNDNYTALGYYQRLLTILNSMFATRDIIIPQIRTDHADLVDTYMKASNNLGVTLSRLSEANGDSDTNGQAIVNLQESIRSWDALTRNQETMLRLNGSNLAEQNLKYIVNPVYGYSPAIYTEIPLTLYGEEGLDR